MDFINGNIKAEEYKEIKEKVQKNKEKYINRKNEKREPIDLTEGKQQYMKSRNVISKTFKLLPKYKELRNKSTSEYYLRDEKGIKYYKDQVKRNYKYENYISDIPNNHHLDGSNDN